MKKTHEAVTGNGSAFTQYREVIVGEKSLLYFLYYEFCIFLSIIPGAVGMVLRKIFWPRLFAACGKGVLFGSNIILRHPGRVRLGSKVVISDRCILDARNTDVEEAITLGDSVMLSNDVMLCCKNGCITIGDNTGINAQTIIQSVSMCCVDIGKDVIIGQRAFIIGGGNYNTDNIDIPIRLQGNKVDGGVKIDDNVWLGANATILGGVSIGYGSIISASCVMTKSAPPLSVCQGTPGRVVKTRT